MFASLALTKMDCNRIANYFLLPVLLGLVYSNIALYHRAHHSETDSHGGYTTNVSSKTPNEDFDNLNRASGSLTIEEYATSSTGTPSTLTETLLEATTTTSTLFSSSKLQRPSFLVDADSFELVFSNALVLLVIVQLVANLLSRKLAKSVK